MGRLHAGKVKALAGEGLLLQGVADPIESRAQSLADECEVRAEFDYERLIADCDVAIVAVPTVAHADIVEACLVAGLDVLVEKPIAATLDEASRMLELAKAHERVLQVGHLEWFNAGMQVIRQRITRPRFVEAHRMGPFPDRATDVDVVRDLMIHDIELLQRLLGEEPERIDAVGIPVLSDEVDIANARLSFACGCVANLTASRVSSTPLRKIRFFQRDGYFSIDFLEQTAVVVRRTESAEGEAPKIEGERLETSRSDALLLQLRGFAEAVRSRARPWVEAEAGLAALRTALRVRDAMPDLDELE
jgi:predicted dehydrogenase